MILREDLKEVEQYIVNCLYPEVTLNKRLNMKKGDKKEFQMNSLEIAT